jgi:hypothetical protein
MKTILAAALGCLLVLDLAGCGGDPAGSLDESANSSTPAAQQDSSTRAQDSAGLSAAAAGSSVPGGSWACSCPSWEVRYGSNGKPAQLIASCYNTHHKLVRNEIWVWNCSTGCFFNNNGKITCGRCGHECAW